VNKMINATPEIYQYILNHSLHESEILQQLRIETLDLPGSQMQISPEQGQFMALMAKLIEAKKILEIGTYTGYSSIVLSQAMPENGHLITCDIDPIATTIAKKFWYKAGLENKITLKLGNALETLTNLIHEGNNSHFDLIFIDADKNNYIQYYEYSLKLIRKGGLIIIDNVLWKGRVRDHSNNDKATNSIRALNDLIYKDNRVEISLVPIADGLTLARKL